MITLNNNAEFITGSVKGKNYSVPYSKAAYEKLLSYKQKYDAADNPNSANAYTTTFSQAVKKYNALQTEEQKVVVGTTGLNLEYQDGQFYLFNGKAYSKFYVPTEIVGRIQESESKQIDATPFYKFFARLLRNPHMTQDKANRIARYISKTWIDDDIKQELMTSGINYQEAAKQATVYQVGITQEGLLVTYKVSTLIGENSENFQISEEEAVDISEVTDIIDEANAKSTSEVDITAFVYTPVRNKKGHFWKRGSDEYLTEYNRQLDEFKYNLAPELVATTVVSKVVANKTYEKSVPATTKYAEDYLFEPAYQGTGGDPFYCGEDLGHIIKVGKVHYLPSWSQVNIHDSQSAVKGLHVGGLDYIQGIHAHNDSRVIHNIFVSPEHIGAVVAVENGDGAMRVKQYFVHSSFIGPNKGLYHSSTYAAKTDEEWDNNLENALETVNNTEAQIEALRKKAVEAQELLDNAF